LEECQPYPVFAGYSLALALQLRKKHVKTSVWVAEEVRVAEEKIPNRPPVPQILDKLKIHFRNTFELVDM